jgi:hypothetical protein
MREIGIPSDNKLRKNPTPGEDVECDDGVTIIVKCTISAQGLKKRIARSWPI